MQRIILCVLTLLCAMPVVAADDTATQKMSNTQRGEATTVEWIDLLPEEDLRLLKSMPQIDHESLTDEELAMDSAPNGFSSNNNSAFEDQVAAAIAEASKKNESGRSWQDALTSTKVRAEFNNKYIRIAGFIVPIEYDDKSVITEFFLVPYFGACIHVPPPPPNQLIFVKYPKGLQLDNLYTPFWVEGTIALETQENSLGLSSYSMHKVKLTEYEYTEDAEYSN